ncbi:MAG: hypothetical protein FJY29_04965 [Betaproteobacteria bacterium]|nr:hypothetical protein [Betaproteobacteria bacterium]
MHCGTLLMREQKSQGIRKLRQKARKAFQKWVLNGAENLSQTETKRNITKDFGDYLRIVTNYKGKNQDAQIESVDVVGQFVRSNLGNTSLDGVFIFDYDPAVAHFSFAKGDSGSLLNIFGGYPVAALSTVDGEPTSGGTAILPLPELDEELDTTTISNSVQKCRR